MIRVNEIKIDIDKKIDFIREISKKMKIDKNEILEYKIFRESIDARKGLKYVYTVDVKLKNEEKIIERGKYKKSPKLNYIYPKKGNKKLRHRPIIIGFGPAGMFVALLLSEKGYNPIVFERGEDVDSRSKSVEKFWNESVLNTESNVQFGEGGAGTFSDGKLTTRIKDLRSRKVLEELVEAGADDSILYKNKPHIGTDKLKNIVKNIRKKIIKNGGEVYFNSKMTSFEKNGDIYKVIVNEEEYYSDILVLAIGHSSRETFEEIYKKGVEIIKKPFAIGMRIEHKQEMINKVQYKGKDVADVLGSAEYHLTYTTKHKRSVYTFCMCPGGMVVASSSEEGGIVTNGMSENDRGKENANSAILVNVLPDDFDDEHPLSGMYFQREIEKKAFKATKQKYFAPYITVGEFLNETLECDEKSLINVKPTYKPGVEKVNPKEYLPNFVVEAIKEALPNFDRKLKGFSNKYSILTGPETRSSSPIRIVRDENYESVNYSGLYPVGEGAGYAGGIVSSAVDGIKVSEKIIEKYFI